MSDSRLRVLDTDMVSHHQAGRRAVVARLLALPEEQVVTTCVTVREQSRGRLAFVDSRPEDESLVSAYAWLQRTVEYFSRVPDLEIEDWTESWRERTRSTQ